MHASHMRTFEVSRRGGRGAGWSLSGVGFLGKWLAGLVRVGAGAGWMRGWGPCGRPWEQSTQGDGERCRRPHKGPSPYAIA